MNPGGNPTFLINRGGRMLGDKNNLGRVLKQRRAMIPLTLHELSRDAGVSASHLGRIERGERFPSARILRKIAKPLGFEESELFTLANYLSPSVGEATEEESVGELDPYVARVLSLESIEVQRIVIGVLTILKSIAKAVE